MPLERQAFGLDENRPHGSQPMTVGVGRDARPRIRLMAVTKLRAPVLWFGGKGRLRARIIPLLPKTQVYVEP